uniref:Ras-GEF domain-containing protein n=1 Tax=Arcella intermedia TaxID=1963864 RepID=A0A6B2L6G7_9EUKA
MKKSVNGSIIAASKDKLFEKLFVGLLKKEVFINTYPLFSTRQEFMNYIIEWFTSEKLHKDPKELSEIRAHIMEILYLWLTMFPGDFRNDDIIKALQVLASTPIEAVEGHIKQFQKLLVDKLNPQISTEGINSPPSILPTHFQPKQFTIVDIHPTEIARQLTLASMKIFSLINPRDLLYWNSKAEEKKLRIMDFINNFNYLCQWAISFILVGINEKQRGFFITHVIYVMIEAFSIGNYHCAVALLACLDGVAISRLKKSWCFVEETQINSLENIRNQLSANGNWKIYRELVQQRQDPCLPYIGVYLQDIFFIEDGNPSTSGELFNFEKMTQFSNCLQEIMRFFYIKYDFKSVPEIQETINSIKVFELKETHRISLTVEPREESVL